MDLAARADRDLWLGIGRLDGDMVRRALQNGADVNRIEELPCYTGEELNWHNHGSPLTGSYPALPLETGLLYRDHKQEAHTAGGEDKRAGITRLLLNNGADLHARLQVGGRWGRTLPMRKRKRSRRGRSHTGTSLTFSVSRASGGRRNTSTTTNARGWTPVQLALHPLRPATVSAIGDLGGSLDGHDPDGYNALHQIAGKRLTKRPWPGKRRPPRPTPNAPDFPEEFKRL